MLTVTLSTLVILVSAGPRWNKHLDALGKLSFKVLRGDRRRDTAEINKRHEVLTFHYCGKTAAATQQKQSPFSEGNAWRQRFYGLRYQREGQSQDMVRSRKKKRCRGKKKLHKRVKTVIFSSSNRRSVTSPCAGSWIIYMLFKSVWYMCVIWP